MSEKRAYRSDTRTQQAAVTRQRILEAAKRLFAEEGFDRVTIPQLADAAGVSKPTIYAVFKSKRGVLGALVDEALPPEQFWEMVEQVEQEPDVTQRLKITAAMARRLYDAEKQLMGLLRSAALIAPELKALEQEREARRYERQGATVKRMQEEGVLKHSLSLPQARDVMWALTGRDLYRLLVMERGWASEQYETWLASQLAGSLLQV